MTERTFGDQVHNVLHPHAVDIPFQVDAIDLKWLQDTKEKPLGEEPTRYLKTAVDLVAYQEFAQDKGVHLIAVYGTGDQGGVLSHPMPIGVRPNYNPEALEQTVVMEECELYRLALLEQLKDRGVSRNEVAHRGLRMLSYAATIGAFAVDNSMGVGNDDNKYSLWLGLPH